MEEAKTRLVLQIQKINLMKDLLLLPHPSAKATKALRMGNLVDSRLQRTSESDVLHKAGGTQHTMISFPLNAQGTSFRLALCEGGL